MAFVWQDKENGVDDILAEHINGVAHEVIRLEEDKVNKDLSNVEDVVFKNKATSAGVAGKVSSVNGKVGDVILSANDVEAYSQIPGINITGRGIEIHSFSDKNIILFAHGDDGSFAVHDLTQKADKATTLSGYGITDAYTIDETDGSIMSHYNVVVKPEITKKADKASILITSESSLILTHNQEARLGEIATLTLSMPTAIDDLYWSSFCFASGATATSISYSGEPIIWCGDDCDADGSFIPEANTMYEVNIKKLGSDIVARVGAY